MGLMWGKKTLAGSGSTYPNLKPGNSVPVSPTLDNLLRDASLPTLAVLAERYGLHRMPGMSKPGLIARIVTHLSAEELVDLEDELIAARYGTLSVDELLGVALKQNAERLSRPGKPRLDQISPDDATLLEGSSRRWVYTMRGHDVTIDIDQRHLACSCRYFSFAAHQHALCKHLVTAFQVIPAIYAREALIDLLVWREYRSGAGQRWQFESTYAWKN
jgi:hypothetical protein